MKAFDSKYESVKELFGQAGISVSEWARINGFSGSLVYQVLEGKRQCLRGQSHQIAVALGLKHGSISSMEEINQRLKGLANLDQQENTSEVGEMK